MLYLTLQERGIVIFLLGMAAVGLSVNFAYKKSPAIAKLATVEDFQDKVDINRAHLRDLLRIKGIGPVLAANIISYRNAYGPFSAVERLQDVKGIGKAKYDQIKDFVITASGDIP